MGIILGVILGLYWGVLGRMRLAYAGAVVLGLRPEPVYRPPAAEKDGSVPIRESGSSALDCCPSSLPSGQSSRNHVVVFASWLPRYTLTDAWGSAV